MNFRLSRPIFLFLFFFTTALCLCLFLFGGWEQQPVEHIIDYRPPSVDLAALWPILDIHSRIRSCTSRELLWPDCEICVVGGPPPCLLAHNVIELRSEIETLRQERNPSGEPYHLYPYLETPEFSSRLSLTAHFIANQKPETILEIGGSFQWIGRFIHGHCPKTIVMIDPVVDAESYLSPCGESSVHIVTISVTASDFVKRNLATSLVPNGHFDAIICIGCDVHWGIPANQLLNFPRPFRLILEISSEYGPSVSQYGRIDQETGCRSVFSAAMDMIEYASPIKTDYTKRWFRVINVEL